MRQRDNRDTAGQSGTSGFVPRLAAVRQAGHGTGQAGHPPLRGVSHALVPVPVLALPARLDDLARRVARLVPNRHDPERYHAEKSEIAFELRQLARLATAR